MAGYESGSIAPEEGKGMQRPKYNHLYVVAFSVDSDDREGGGPDEIMRALRRRVHELEQTGEILEAVGVPDETIDNGTGLEVEVQ
jgi:hypothetical protein